MQPGGTYTVVGDVVRVKLALRKDGQTLGAPLQVEGSQSDLPALIRRLLTAIQSVLAKTGS